MYCVEYPAGSNVIIAIDSDNTWRFAGKIAAGYQSTPFRTGFGTWSGTFGDMIDIWGPNGTGREGKSGGTPWLELRRASGKEGPAYDPGRQVGSTNLYWRRVARPSEMGLWVGLAGKGGGELGIGAEIDLGVVISAQLPSRWFAFGMKTGRIGAAAGIGGGLSLAIVTGVNAPNQIETKAYVGTDWAVSIGERWGTLAKNGLKAFGKTIQELSELGDRVKFCIEHGDWLVQLGKGAYQEACLDCEELDITIVDTPVGGGLELGYYFYLGEAYVIAQGSGTPASNTFSARR